MNKCSVEALVTSSHGLHARPAMQLSELAQTFASEIAMAKKEVGQEPEWIDAKSVMHVLTLGAIQHTLLVIRAEGEDAGAACQKLKEFIENMKDLE